MTDFKEMFTSLSEEADSVMNATPDALRRRGDRRSRIGMAAAAVAVVALVGVVGVGTQWILTPRGTNVQPATSSSTSASAAPPNIPNVIPASAFLQTADLNGAEDPVETSADNMLPRLCGVEYASDSLIRVRRTMHLTYWISPSPPGTVPDGTFDETITTYEQNGADQFMRQLRDAVTACPTEQRDATTYRNRILPGTTRGDESILIEQRYPTRNTIGEDDVRLVSVVRTGAVVMVLYELGWEDGWSAEQPVVDGFTGKAFSRLQSWLG